MSPEQAKGKTVDKRGDIWAFGVVLAEMLTGRRLYNGDTISETLAAVLLKEPDLTGLPASTPAAIRRLLRRCLDKDPQERLRDIGEARIAIGTPVEEMPSAATPRHALLPWAIAGTLALATLAAGVVAWRATRPIDRPLMWLSVDLGPEARAGRDFTVAISPDGSRLVFPVGEIGASKLAVRLLGQPNATPLLGTEGGVNPFFSPDGEWVAFSAGGKLKKVPIRGGRQ